MLCCRWADWWLCCGTGEWHLYEVRRNYLARTAFLLMMMVKRPLEMDHGVGDWLWSLDRHPELRGLW